MAKEKVQNKVHAIQWPKKRYKIKYRQSNGKRKSTTSSTGNQMAKEKVQNKGQTMHRPQTMYNIKYKQSNGKRKSTK